MKSDNEFGVLASVSDDNETEWNEEIDDPGTCFVGDRESAVEGAGG